MTIIFQHIPVILVVLEVSLLRNSNNILKELLIKLISTKLSSLFQAIPVTVCCNNLNFSFVASAHQNKLYDAIHQIPISPAVTLTLPPSCSHGPQDSLQIGILKALKLTSNKPQEDDKSNSLCLQASS